MSTDGRFKRLALGTASIFLLIVGALLNVQQMYLMAIALSLIPLVFWFIGLFFQRGIDVRRELPDSCERGERVKIDLVLHNSSIFPKFYLRGVDRLPRWVKFDGNGENDAAMLLRLGPHETAKLTYYIRPFRRGKQPIGPTKITNPDLIGLSNYTRFLNDPTDILVFPEVMPVSAQFLTGGASQGWKDQENATTRGPGTDFQGVREYRTGDDLRRVNWKTTARTGSLAVTEYALGYANDMTIALDMSRAGYGDSEDYYGSAFETAIEIAASLASAGLDQGSSVQFITNGKLSVGDQLLHGDESRVALLTALALAQANSKRSLAETLYEYASATGNDRSLIVISSASPFDAEMHGALDFYKRSRPGMVPLNFWIDVPAYNNRIQFSFHSVAQGQEASPDIYTSLAGKNVVVRPDSDLRSLFTRVMM